MGRGDTLLFARGLPEPSVRVGAQVWRAWGCREWGKRRVGGRALVRIALSAGRFDKERVGWE